MMNKLKNLFRKKKEINFDSEFAVIETTNAGINSFVNDKFNKKLVLYRNWDSYMNKISFFEIPYTEEDAKNIYEIYEMPVIEENLEMQYEFGQEEDFGEVTNRI